MESSLLQYARDTYGTLSPETTQTQIQDLYGKWAATYDTDINESVKYVGHKHIASKFHSFMEKREFQQIRILDVAAGTGLVGQELSFLGYQNIDALDASKAMLTEADRKGVYKNIIEGYIGNDSLSIEQKSYDAIVCSGAFTKGHLPAAAMDEMIALVKQGGILCFNIRDNTLVNDSHGYQRKLEEILKQETVKLHSETKEIAALDDLFAKGNIGYHIIYILEVV